MHERICNICGEASEKKRIIEKKREKREKTRRFASSEIKKRYQFSPVNSINRRLRAEMKISIRITNMTGKPRCVTDVSASVQQPLS